MLNTRFPQFIRSTRDSDENERIKLEITYSKEALLGEKLNISYLETENEICYQEKNSENLTCCTCRISNL